MTILESSTLEKTEKSHGESSKDINAMSLNMLRDFLKLNNYYLNTIQYKNIIVDVTVLISIKEGRKILKGIKHLLKHENTSNKCTIEGIVETRSYLLLLKMVIDVLFTTIEKNTHIFVKKNNQLKTFLALLDSIMDTLNTNIQIPEEDIQFMCHTVCSKLDHIQNAVKVENHEFIIYYFKKPLRHLYDLFSLQ